MEIVFHFGTSFAQYSIESTTSRIDGEGGKMNSFLAMNSLRMSFCSWAAHPASHRRRGREDEFLLGDELLEDVVLQRAAQLRARHTLLLGDGDVHAQQDRGRR